MSQELLTNVTYSFAVGTPVTNCDSDNNSTVQSASEGSITLQDTWSAGASIGWDIFGLQVGAQGGWSRTEAKTYSQTITINVNPGQKVRSTVVVLLERELIITFVLQGVLVAQVLFKRTQGTMKVGTKFVLPSPLLHTHAADSASHFTQ